MKKIIFSVLFFMFGTAHAFSVQCPERIQVDQHARTTVDKWESFQSPDAVHPLDGVTFYSGHPKEQASLAPDRADKRKAVWTFPARDTIYVACSYRKSSVELVQVLSPVKRCEVKYDGNQEGFVPKSIECGK